MASCVSGTKRNRGNVSPRTLIRNPLISKDSRSKVLKFFEDSDLRSAISQLKLWELCDTLLEHNKHVSTGWYSRFVSSNYTERDIWNEAKFICQFIDQETDHIDFNVEELRNAVASGNLQYIVAEVRNTQETTTASLDPKLKDFSEAMRQEYNLN